MVESSGPTSSLDKILLDQDTNDQFIRQLMTSLVTATQASNALPTGTDYKYQMATNKAYAKGIDMTGKNLVDLLKTITRFVNGSDVEIPDDFQNPAIYDHVVDLVDKLLEDADIQLDQLSGKSAKFKESIHLPLTVNKDQLLRGNIKDIPKPQLKFLTEIDNSRERPFRPRITTKPNNFIPLDLTERKLSSVDMDVVMPAYYYPHPYEHELKKLRYPDWQLEDPSSKPSWMPTAQQPFEFIANEDNLHRMIDELQYCREVAIDLEHHNFHSFQGFTCLMQISSREKDYIVDTIALRSSMQALNIVTTNPEIVKVFHGCESDILWLQKDFGIYVLNCFDTYHAASLLRYPALSLANLMKVFCNVSADKKHQLSDWRQRPLPAEMIAYAKDDTHYLLYIYDCIRKEIWKEHSQEGIEIVLNTSKKTCMLRYEKEFFWPLGYRKLLKLDGSDNAKGTSKYSYKAKDVSATQDNVMACIWEWRDAQARAVDESVVAVMSNAELLRIAMTMPVSVAALLAECTPLSDNVRQAASSIVEIIRGQLEVGPSSQHTNFSSSSLSVASASASVGFASSSTAQQNKSSSGGISGKGGSRKGSKALSFDQSDVPLVAASVEGNASDINRLYGRALRTPSKDIIQAVNQSPSPVQIIGSLTGQHNANNNHLLYQPYNHNTILTLNPKPQQPSASSSAAGSHRPVQEAPSPLICADELFSFARWDSGLGSNKATRGAAVGAYGGNEDSDPEEMDEHIERLTRAHSDAEAKSLEIRARVKLHTAGGSSTQAASAGGGGKDNRSGGIPGFGDSIEMEEGEEDEEAAPLADMDQDDDEFMGEDEMLAKLPASFSEIYAISNTIRRQNREKKRGRDGNEPEPAASAPLQISVETAETRTSLSNRIMSSTNVIFDTKVMGSTIFDESVYFQYAKENANNSERDIDATLDVAQSIGWIADNGQREEIKQSFIQEQMTETGDDEQSPRHPDSEGPASSGGNPLRRSSDSMSSIGGKDSSGRPLSGKGNSLQGKSLGTTGSSSTGNNSSASTGTGIGVPKAYDYNKFSHGSIGAMPIHENSNSTSTNSSNHNNNHHSQKNRNNNSGGGSGRNSGRSAGGNSSSGAAGGRGVGNNPYFQGSKKR